MPDKYICQFIEAGIVDLILTDLVHYTRPVVICNLLRVLCYLASHQDCKAYILRLNGLEISMRYLEHRDDGVKYQALKLVHNLG